VIFHTCESEKMAFFSIFCPPVLRSEPKNHEKSKYQKFVVGSCLKYPKDHFYKFWGDFKHFPGRSRIFRAKNKILRKWPFYA